MSANDSTLTARPFRPMSIVLAVGALGALVVALRLLATVAAHLVEQASPPSWDERLPTHAAYERASDPGRKSPSANRP